MGSRRIKPSTISGSLSIPPSKSQTLRALLFGFLGRGKSIISNPLQSPDTVAMVRACTLLGGEVTQVEKGFEITGRGGEITRAEDVIDCGNSGILLRFLSAVAALGSHPIVFTGDESIRHQRPMQPLLEGLEQLGVRALSTKGDGFAPVIIEGPLEGKYALISGEDSQCVSALLIAAAFAESPVELYVQNPGEKPWVDLTLSWFDRLGIAYEREGYEYYRLSGKSRYEGFSYRVPGDFSSAAFPLAAALVTGSELTLRGLAFEDPQGDKQLIQILREMGASIICEPEQQRLHVRKSSALQGRTIDVNHLIDATPILAVLGCFAEGETQLRGAEGARYKECDRLSAIVCELKKMGAQIEELPDGLRVRRSPLKGAHVSAHADHRMAMALTVAGLAAKGETQIEGTACTTKTYPGFFEQLKNIGGEIGDDGQ